MDILYEHKEIDIEYCAVWANENWTRTWDGLEKNVLIAQKYAEDDPERFIRDLSKYLDDGRYLRVNGKPVIIVYAPKSIPSIGDVFSRWRAEARKEGIGDILIWTCRTFNQDAGSLKISDFVDGEVEFPPHNIVAENIEKKGLEGKGVCIKDYGSLVDFASGPAFKTIRKGWLHKSVMLAWDNSPRRSNFTSFGNFRLGEYYRWLRAVTDYTVSNFNGDDCIQFINAWNEWAEGTYLEPDVRYGYANIDVTSQALLGRPFCGQKLNFGFDMDLVGASASRAGGILIAVQVHLFYTDLCETIIRYLNLIPFKFDVFISTDTEDKKSRITEIFGGHCRARRVQVDVFENRGRDVLPFVLQMRPHLKDYDYVCHLHSKKSSEYDSGLGDGWRAYLYNNLLGSREYIESVIGCFEKFDEIGLIFPDTFPTFSARELWGDERNKAYVEEILKRMGENDRKLSENIHFPVGDMFWSRASILASIFSVLDVRDFEAESGQLDGTMAHAFERFTPLATEALGNIWVNYSWDADGLRALREESNRINRLLADSDLCNRHLNESVLELQKGNDWLNGVISGMKADVDRLHGSVSDLQTDNGRLNKALLDMQDENSRLNEEIGLLERTMRVPESIGRLELMKYFILKSVGPDSRLYKPCEKIYVHLKNAFWENEKP